MAAERNRALLRRVIDEILNAGDLDLADALFAPSYINHLGVIPDLVLGPEAIKVSIALYRAAFPDLYVRIDDLVSEGDTVELHWTASDGSPEERTATADSRSLTGTTLSRVADNQIVESWTDWDAPGTLRRLNLADSEDSTV